MRRWKLSAACTGTTRSSKPQTIEGGDLDPAEAVADVVADHGLERVAEGGAAKPAVHLLPEQVRSQPLRIADDPPGHHPAGPWTGEDLPAAVGGDRSEGLPCEGGGGCPPFRVPGVEDAGGRDQDEAVKATGRRRHRLGGDEAAHRVADEGAALDAELLAEVMDEAPVGGDVGSHVGIGLAPKPGRSRAIARRSRPK